MPLLPSVFWEVFHRAGLTRAELAAILSVSPPSISRPVERLVASHLLIEPSPLPAARGRPPAMLRVNPAAARFAGIEIDGDRIIAAVTDMAGRPLGRGAVAGDTGASPEWVARDCVRAFHAAAKDAGIGPSGIAGAGVGSA